MAYQSLYRRYRSRRFGELVGQPHVVTALRNAVREGRTGHAYLFSGPRGTGKTSVARILAKALNCTDLHEGEPCGRCESCLAIDAGRSYDLHELDAASNNGVEAMRDLIAKAAIGSPGRSKVYILDEVHMLSTAASNALLKTLEEPPAHVTFVLATTDPQKVLPTIRSRCQHLEFGLIPAAELEAHVRWVAADAGLDLDLDDEVVAYVVRRGAGSARDTLSVLEQVAALGGIPDDGEPLGGLLEALVERDSGAALAAVARLVAGGREPRFVAEQLLARLRDGFLVTMGAPLGGVPDHELEEAGRIGRALGPAGVTRALEALGDAIVEMRQAPDARVPLEVALIRLTRPELDTSVAALLERVAQLEQGLAALGSTSTGSPPPGALDEPGSRPSSDAADPAATSGRSAPSRPGPTGAAAEARRRIQARNDTAPKAEAPSEPTAGTEVEAPAAAGDRAPDRASEPASDQVADPSSDPPVTPTRPSEPTEDGTLPSVEELAAAWRDAVFETLAPAAKARFRAGRFLDVANGATGGRAAVYGLPNAIHRDRCEERRPEVEAALARHFGRAVPLRLVVDEAAGALPAGAAPPPFGTSGADGPGRADPSGGRRPGAVHDEGSGNDRSDASAGGTGGAETSTGRAAARNGARDPGPGSAGDAGRNPDRNADRDAHREVDRDVARDSEEDADLDIDVDDLHALPDATDVVATVTDRIMQAFPGSQVVE